MRRLLVLFFLVIFSAACRLGSEPKGVIPEEKMIGVLTDMHLVDGFTSGSVDTLKIVGLYKTVYKNHEIDSLTFRKSLEYYSKDPAKLQRMYAKVTGNLEKLQKAEQKKAEKKLKEQQKREKKTADSLKRVEKVRLDSIKRDSIKKEIARKALLKKDSLKRDSIRKAKLERLKLKKK
jgi:hypothetical protein